MNVRTGEVIGVAGFSLERTGTAWAANADVAVIGGRGERRTAEALNTLARRPGGPTVLHDLIIPVGGTSANIDHVLVAGRTVVLIDTKVWKPGFYWTLNSRTRRGLEPFTYADKATMSWAVASLSRYLSARPGSAHARMATPMLLVWSSQAQHPVRLWAQSPPRATSVPASSGLRRLGLPRYRRSAEVSIVQALIPLVASLRAETTTPAAAESNENALGFGN